MAEEITEKQELEGLASYLNAAREGLDEKDWEISQGALREFFNRMPEFLKKSELPADKRKKLEGVVEFVNDSREQLIQGMEVNLWELDKTIDFYHLYERLDVLKEILGNYIAAWYNH